MANALYMYNGGRDPAQAMVTCRETWITSNIVPSKYEFKILSEIAPNVFHVSGESHATDISLDQLETTLAGTVFLAESDGRYRERMWTWLRRYSLSRADESDELKTFRLAAGA
ncbi:hypothetical protein LSUB1_G000323 [Lachnellula subtilissima]|uniref:Uncharacterized protein n=1 Tax=Lachnellula subtilissima TaxID=602034 RepID=A0A8H8S355_9HELO|nr:hypothetical protein LSUB1_G000323 [Lachnellula subtilissima]